MAEYGAFVKPAKKNRDGFWHTKVPQSAVHMKRIQIVLKSFSHRLHQRPLIDQDWNATQALLLVYKGKGYARKVGRFFMPDLQVATRASLRTMAVYVKNHPFLWLTKRQLMVKLYTLSKG